MKNIVPKLKMKRKDFWKYISISHENAKNNNEFIDYLINILLFLILPKFQQVFLLQMVL